MRTGRRGGVLAGIAAAVCVGLFVPSAATADTCEGAQTPVDAQNLPELERTLLCLTNVFRVENGLGALTMDPDLRRAAHEHSADVGTYDLTNPAVNTPDAHPDPDDPQHTPGNPHFNPFVAGKYTPQDRADLAGYPDGVGENIAWSNFPVWTPTDLVEGWKNSPGHRQNLLGPSYETAGMGLSLANGVTGTQMFGVSNDGATDIAVDLLITDGCAAARGALPAAGQAVNKARKKLKRADTKAERKAAKRKLRKAKRKLAQARAAESAACSPTSF